VHACFSVGGALYLDGGHSFFFFFLEPPCSDFEFVARHVSPSLASFPSPCSSRNQMCTIARGWIDASFDGDTRFSDC